MNRYVELKLNHQFNSLKHFFSFTFEDEGTVDFKEFVNVMENYRSLCQDDEAAMYFKVFDSEHRGYIEGKAIKRSFQFLDDVPISEIEEIVTKMDLTDDKKITIEGKYLLEEATIRAPPQGGHSHILEKWGVACGNF